MKNGSKKKMKDSTDLALFVRASSDEIISWDCEKITNALIKETGIDEITAKSIAKEVEDQIVNTEIKTITAPLIRELVNAKLIERGLEEYRTKHTRLGMPIYDVEQLLLHANKSNANVPHGPEATNLTLAESIKKEYGLLCVFSKEVADAHLEGDLHVHDLGFIDRVYSFKGSECVFVRDEKDNKVFSTSLEKLFNRSKFKEIEHGVYEGFVKGYQVYDKNGWTDVIRVIKKVKDKETVFIKTGRGNSIIVTTDHPMVVQEDDELVPAEDIQVKDHSLFHQETPVFNGDKEYLDFTELDLDNEEEGRKFYISGVELLDTHNDIWRYSQDVTLSRYKELKDSGVEVRINDGATIYYRVNGKNKGHKLPFRIKITSDFCYFLGMFISEGCYGKGGITLTIQERDIKKITNTFKNLNWNFSVREIQNCFNVEIYSKTIREILYRGLNIGRGSKNISIPGICFTWKKEFLFDIVSGIIDGEGCVSTNSHCNKVEIEVISREMVNQIKQALSIENIQANTSFRSRVGQKHKYKNREITTKNETYSINFSLDNDKKYLFKESYKVLRLKKKHFSHKKEDKIVKSVPIQISDEYVYDITTSSGTFYCNGLLVHNCSGQSLEYVKKFGLDLPNSLSIARPAKHAEVLLAHMVKFSAALQGQFSGALGWDAVNLFFAPYLVNKTYEEIKQLAQMMIYEFSQQAVSRGGQAIFSDINLYWEVPKHFKKVPAIGPGGEFTGLMYQAYEKEAQDFVWALYEVYKEGDGCERPFFFPKPLLHITEEFFKTDRHMEFLNHVCEVVSEKGTPYFVFDRGDTSKISQCCFWSHQEVIVEVSGKVRCDTIGNVCSSAPNNLKVLHNGIFRKAKSVITTHSDFIRLTLYNNAVITMTDNHICKTSNRDKEAKYLCVNDYLPIDVDDSRFGYVCPRGFINVHGQYMVKIKKIESFSTNNLQEVYCFEMEDQSNPYFTLANGIETHNCRLSFKLNQRDLDDAKTPWKMRYCALQNVTINLPRLAYLANNDDDKLFLLITDKIILCAKAHIEKKNFIQKLLDLGSSSPLSLLTMNRDGESYVKMDRASYLIGILGLNELVQHHIGGQLHESENAVKFGLKVISHMKMVTEELAKEHNMKFVLEQTPAESTAYRFARIDMKKYPEQTKKVIKGIVDSEEIYYTNSTLWNVSSNTNPIERVTKEGLFHPLITAGSITHVWLGETKPDKEALAKFVINTFKKTNNDQIAFSPEFTTCIDCNKTGRGLKDKCEYCGSENVDGITRITGYFTKTSSWNKGKLAELKDRYRNKGMFNKVVNDKEDGQ